jgi:hypothetical protein
VVVIIIIIIIIISSQSFMCSTTSKGERETEIKLSEELLLIFITLKTIDNDDNGRLDASNSSRV